MTIVKKSSFSLLIILAMVRLTACGGGGDGTAGSGSTEFSVGTGTPAVHNSIPSTSVTPTSLVFEAAPLNQEMQKSLVFINSGTKDLSVDISTDNSGEFQFLDPDTSANATELSDITVAAGTSYTVTVRYLHSVAGNASALLTIQDTESKDKLTMSLSGSTTAGSGATAEKVVIVPSTETCGGSTANKPVDAGDIDDGSTASVSLKICNGNATAPVYITDVAKGGTSTASWLTFPIAAAVASEPNTCSPTGSTAIAVKYVDLKVATSDIAAFITLTDETGGALAFPLQIPANSFVKVKAKIKPDLSKAVEALAAGEVAKSVPWSIPLVVKTKTLTTSTPLSGRLIPSGPRVLVNGKVLNVNASLSFDKVYIPQDKGATIEAAPQRTLELKNSGSKDSQVTLALKNTKPAVGTFEFDGACPAWPLTIAAGESRILTLRYNALTPGIGTGELRMTSNSVDGNVQIIPLISSAESIRLSDWKYKTKSLEAVTESAAPANVLSLGKIQWGATTKKTFAVQNNSAVSGNTLLTTFAITNSSPNVTMAYADDLGRTVPFTGQPLSISLAPGTSKNVDIFFTTNTKDKQHDSTATFTGTIAITNKLSKASTSLPSYTLNYTVTETPDAAGVGSPVSGEVKMRISNVTMVVFSGTYPTITSNTTFYSDLWSFSDMNKDKKTFTANAVKSSSEHELAKQLTIGATKWMGYKFDDAGLLDPAVNSKDYTHYFEPNNDPYFDFEYNGKMYCIDSTWKIDPKDITCGTATGASTPGTPMSEQEFGQMQYDFDTVIGVETVWNTPNMYRPEYVLFYIDLAETPNSIYIVDEDNNDQGTIIIPNMDLHLKVGPNAESWRISGAEATMQPHSTIDEDLQITFTTDIIDGSNMDLIATKNQGIDPDTGKIKIDPAYFDAKNPLVNTPENYPKLKPYIREKNGHYYFGGSPVIDWDTRCLKVAGFMYVPEPEDQHPVSWLFRQSAALVLMTLQLNPTDDTYSYDTNPCRPDE